jgi:EmrB/QacA subfamily drug resistance transporter
VITFTTKTIEGKLILLATILASGMAFLDSSVVNIAIPTIQEKLHATISNAEWVVNAYALMLASLILISGSLGDHFGRKKIFVYGIGTFILASFLCGISQNILQLILFRGLQGIGGAMMVPGSLSIINTNFAENIRGRVIGLWSGFAGGVAAIGPFLGGYLVQTFGWQAIFYINIPLGLLALWITIQFVPEEKNEQKRKVDFLGATSIFLSLLGITYGLMKEPSLGWTNPTILVSLLGGLILFIFFILTQMKSKHPLIPLEIFSSSFVTGANLATLFLYFALSGVIFFLVLNIQQVQHFSPLLAGMSMLPTVLLITFLSGPGGTIADKIGPRIPMTVGSFIVAIGMATFVIPTTNANYFLYFFPGLILFGLGMSLVIAPLTKSALLVDSKYSGTASGVNNAVARVAGLLAIALLGLILVTLFSSRLEKGVKTSSLTKIEQQQILDQREKLGAITIPQNFSQGVKEETQTIIDNSFVYGFKWIMGINAFLALLSGIVSFFLIRKIKK